LSFSIKNRNAFREIPILLKKRWSYTGEGKLPISKVDTICFHT